MRGGVSVEIREGTDFYPTLALCMRAAKQREHRELVHSRPETSPRAARAPVPGRSSDLFEPVRGRSTARFHSSSPRTCPIRERASTPATLASRRASARANDSQRSLPAPRLSMSRARVLSTIARGTTSIERVRARNRRPTYHSRAEKHGSIKRASSKEGRETDGDSRRVVSQQLPRPVTFCPPSEGTEFGTSTSVEQATFAVYCEAIDTTEASLLAGCLRLLVQRA